MRCGEERLTHKQRARLEKAIAAHERHEEVSIAWPAAQQLLAACRAEKLAKGRRIAEKVLVSFPTCPIPLIRPVRAVLTDHARRADRR